MLLNLESLFSVFCASSLLTSSSLLLLRLLEVSAT
jgi:hypothetical protein